MIGKILKDASKPGARFEGYATQAETDRKILRDVFEKGDVWFRTGDLMRKDADGYFFFVDRIGDTFRWKGENVSTTEVEEAIGQFPDALEANVYGVEIPGRDGRAGMAAIVAKEHFNLTAFRDHLVERLPEYARPVFLRLRGEIDVTATFKQNKIDLVKEGFDPAASGDPIYFNDPDRECLRAPRRRALRAHPRRRGPACERQDGAPATPADVLAFWRAAGPDKWFNKDAAFDAEIGTRFLPTYRSGRRRPPGALGGDARGRAGAARRARPVPAQHVPRQRAHLRGRSARPRGRRSGDRRGFDARRSPHAGTPCSSICRSSIRRTAAGPGALRRAGAPLRRR